MNKDKQTLIKIANILIKVEECAPKLLTDSEKQILEILREELGQLEFLSQPFIPTEHDEAKFGKIPKTEFDEGSFGQILLNRDYPPIDHDEAHNPIRRSRR